MGDFPYLEWLTRHYLEEAELRGDWRSYLQAHGLANYCVVVDPREERRRLVYDIEDSWYKGEHPLTPTQHQQLTNEHKQLLEAYRGDTRLEFMRLETLARFLDEKKLSDQQNLEKIKKVASEVTKASQVCSEGLENVSKNIITTSVDNLKQVGRVAPCAFAVLGLGSIAKGEATPYSDLEYAFLVEHDDEYFTSLAMDSYFRLGNLGESPLKTFDIQELKSGGNQLPLATAQRMKAGLRIDGITTNSGNIPTGNGKDNSQSLTLTVDGFMELYKTSAESPFDGMPGDKSDMLSSTAVIYTNEGKALGLHLDFEKARKKYEENEACVKRGVTEKRFESFKIDLKKYAFLPKFAEFKPPANLDVEVKTDIFRYPTLLANNIKMCLGLDTRYSWDVFNQLKSKGMLSAENHMYIQTVLALSIYMRTSAYLHQGCQTEVVVINPFVTEYSSRFYPIDVKLFVMLGRFLIPVKQHMSNSLLAMDTLVADRTGLYSVINDAVKTLEVDTTDTFVNAEVLYFVGLYHEAMQLLSHQSNRLTHLAEMLNYYRSDHEKWIKHIKLYAYLLYNTGNYATALKYFNYFITSQPGGTRVWNLLSAHCKQELGDYQSARRLLDEVRKATGEHNFGALDVIRTLYGADSIHQDTASCYHNIGILYHSLGEYRNACESMLESLKMKQSVYGAAATHPHIAAVYNNIGSAYYSLGEYTSALEYLTKSLEMKKAVHRAEANHPDIAVSYNNIGQVYSGLGEDNSARENYTKSLKMKKAVYGAEANHPDVATTYNNLGGAYARLGENTSALENYTKSLEMMKAVHGAEANHPFIAVTYNNIGEAYARLGESTSALEKFTKSLEMMKAVYGAEANHTDIASSYNNIGGAYKDLGVYTSALKYHTKSLEMRETVYGADANHPDIAASYHNVGEAYSGLGEYASALEYYTRSLEMTAVYGAEATHPHLASSNQSSHRSIGRLYHKLGDYRLSQSHLTNAVTIICLYVPDRLKVDEFGRF